MKKNELVTKALELGLIFDEKKETIATLTSMLDDVNKTNELMVKIDMDINNSVDIIPIISTKEVKLIDCINSTLSVFDIALKELLAKIENEKKATNTKEVETLTSDIKTLRGKIKDVVTLKNLYSIKDVTTSTKFFNEISAFNALGQYYNFQFDYAVKLTNAPDVKEVNSELSEMRKTLSVITDTISTIDNSQMYENISKDILPRYKNEESIIDFATCKKTIETFSKDNSTIFASGINICINNDDAKTFITTLIRVTKSHKRNDIKLVTFDIFLNEYQKTISTKINKIALKIAEMKKSKSSVITKVDEPETSTTETAATVDTKTE